MKLKDKFGSGSDDAPAAIQRVLRLAAEPDGVPDIAAMSGNEIGELLDSIPGALERAKQGIEQIERGDYITLDELR